MDKAHPLSTLMVVRSLNIKKDPYCSIEENEEVLGPKLPYLSVVRALIHLTQCTRPDISLSVNLLARHIFAPTQRHCTGIKHILQYLHGTTNLGIFCSYDPRDFSFVGYID